MSEPPVPSAMDLNADLGEGFPWDGELLRLVTSASISCGAHAGDEAAILETLRLASDHRVCVGAHPGYPDRAGFGRQEQVWDERDLGAEIVRQVTFLKELAKQVGVDVRYFKPHGALYNQAQEGEAIGRGVVWAATELRLPLMGLPGSALERRAGAAGIGYIGEGFLDRRYDAEGRLVSRLRPDAYLVEPSEIQAQLLQLVRRVGVRTLCIHGDRADAVELARRAREDLENYGIAVRSFLDARVRML